MTTLTVIFVQNFLYNFLTFLTFLDTYIFYPKIDVKMSKMSIGPPHKFLQYLLNQYRLLTIKYKKNCRVSGEEDICSWSMLLTRCGGCLGIPQHINCEYDICKLPVLRY